MTDAAAPVAGLLAHTGVGAGGGRDVATVALLGVVAVLYTRWASGAPHRSAGRDATARWRWRTAAFAGGWLALAAALTSPLEAAADGRFAWHMVQHLLLTTVAAPLLAVGDVGRALRAALPRRGRVVGAAVGRRTVPLTRPTAALPLAGLLATATFLSWHAPGLYDLAVRDAAVHVVEHATMLGTAYLLWRAVVVAARRGAGLAAAATVAVVGLPEIALGALLAVSPEAWYAAYALAPDAALADQQLGGLLMWIPTGVVHLGVALALGFRCLQEAPAPVVQPPVTPFDRRLSG